MQHCVFTTAIQNAWRHAYMATYELMCVVLIRVFTCTLAKICILVFNSRQI